MKRAVVALAFAGIALGHAAWSDSKRYPPKPIDSDEQAAQKSSLWEKASNPKRKPYEDLLAEAQTSLDDKSTTAAREAIGKLSEAIKLIPDDPRAYQMRGDAYMATLDWMRCAADFTDAILHLEKPRHEHDDHALEELNGLRRKLGLCQARAGRLADAERTLADAAASGHVPGEVWVRLGEVRVALGKLDEAIAALEVAEQAPDVALPLVRWLLMGAYDRARQPAKAAEMGKWAIEGNPADGSRRSYDREMSLLKNPAMPLLGPGESEYLQGVASAYFNPPRPEYGLIYFEKFLELAPDSPWRRRAREHLRELKTATLPEYVDQRGGNVLFDKQKARTAVRRAMPRMRACMANTPGMIIEVTLTKNGPRSKAGMVPARRGAPPEGTTTLVRENIEEVSVAARDGAIRCVETIATRVRGTLPPIKERDSWYRAQFIVVGP